MGILPDWLTGWFARVAGDIGQHIADAIHWAIHAVASVFMAVFAHVFGAWEQLFRWVAEFYRAFGSVLYWVGAKFWHILRVVIPRVIDWARWWFTRLLGLIRAWVAWLWGKIRETIALIYREIGMVIRWAVTHIWDPLWHWVQFLWGRVKAWAWVAFWWVTHLASLAEAMIFHIAAAVERHAWELAGLLGRFFLALLIRNLARFVKIVEQIIAAVI